MKGLLFTVVQRNLVLAMAKLQKFREQKSTILYMDYVYFESNGQEIYYVASDMENSATLKLPGVVEINAPFKICIEKTFLLTLTTLECNISFEVDGDICFIHSPDGKVTIPVLEAEDFPRPPENGEKLFLIPEGKLLNILKTIVPFTFHEPIDSNNALHFKFFDKALRIGAYDNFICAATELRMQPEKEHSFMISSKSASMVTGILEENSAEICTVSLSKNDIVFKTKDAVISCRQMVYDDMKEPNDYYRMSMTFVSKEADIMKIEDKAYLMQQLHKATVFNTKANQVVILNLARNKITIDVEDTLMGRRSVQECIVTFKHEGDTERALVNCNKLMTVLKAIPSEQFDLRVPLENGSGEGCIGIPLTVAIDNFIFVIATLTT